MRYILILLLTFPLWLSALTIKSIAFEGIVHLSDDVAKDILAIEEGDWLDEMKLNEGIKKLYKQGYFDDIAVYEDNGHITIVCKEKPVISKVSVKGFKDGDKEKQDGVIQVKKGQIFTPQLVSDAKKRIMQALEQDGAIDSVVEANSEVLENGSVAVEFLVNKGKKITIASMILAGAKEVDTTKMQENLANKAAQSFGWLPWRNDGELKLPELKIDPLRIKDFYMQNGYLDAKVETPILRVDFNSYTAELSYNIKEGTQYVIDTITYKGYKDIVKSSEINASIALKKGEVFNIQTFREDVERIKTRIADKGYAFAQVRPDLRKNEDNSTVDIIFDVLPGEKVRIRNVIISGNDRTLDRVVRREIFLAPGDWYNASDLKDSKAALGRTGFFEDSTIEEKRISAHEMDLLVHVKEAPTGNIQVGGGYGSYGGLSFDASISDRNIFGSGINTAIKVQQSMFQTEYSVSVSNNRINDSLYSGSINLFINEFELVNASWERIYRSSKKGASLSIGKRLTRTLNGNIAYRLIDSEFVGSENATTPAAWLQPYVKSSISLSLQFNNTDDYYVPRKGFNISNNFEVAGLSPDIAGEKQAARFVKEMLNVQTYYGLHKHTGIDAIIRYKFNGRIAHSLGFIPLDEHFSMGGLGSVRGYRMFSLPNFADQDGSLRRAFDATKMVTNSLELSMPLVKSARLRWAVFVDYGMIGRDVLWQERRGGYGAQLEWFSPMGPIALIFAQPFDDKPGDNLNWFEFSIGRTF